MRIDRIRTAVVCAVVALVIIVIPAHRATAQDPTEVPASEPPADTTPEEDEQDEDEDEEPAPEPSEVSPVVWVGVIALVVTAVTLAARRATKKPTPAGEP